ncbi:MAG: hypothetical protein ABIO06_04170 [Pseudolysinimonas sp.]
MSIWTRVVKMAAGSLPRRLRDRYREQWLADIRDAPEQGVSPAQIALGSAAFAFTVGRSLPSRRELTSRELERRARIARLVALSAALVGLSQYASMAAGYGLGDNDVPDQPALGMAALLMAYALLGSALALLLAFGTPGAPPRARWTVALFATASAAPIVQSSISADVGGFWSPALRPSAIVYAIGAILVIVGILLTGQQRRSSALQPRAAIVAATAILLVGAATLADAVVLWSLREPLRFGDGTRTANNPIYVQWLQLKEQFESLMMSIFVWWGLGLIVLVAGFVAFALMRRLQSREIVRLSVGAAALTLLAGGGLLGFLQLAQPGIVPPAEVVVVLIVGRLVLLSAFLLAAGGRVATAAASAEPALVH